MAATPREGTATLYGRTIGPPIEIDEMIHELSDVSTADCISEFRSLPRVQFQDEALISRYLSAKLPVIIENADVVKHSIDHWDLEYLSQKLGSRKLTVYESTDGRSFRYFDEKKNSLGFEYESPFSTLDLTLSEFVAQAKERSDVEKLLYLQQSLNGFGELGRDFAAWNWTWVLSQTKAHEWGFPDNNLLLIGMKNARTPTHFDERENLFAQGKKRVIMYPPSDYARLYPYPVGHPCDRQAMVDIMNPDLEAFPKFRHARGMIADLKPGDILFLPAYWWHDFMNLDEFTTSVTFWCMQAKTRNLPSATVKMDPTTTVAVRRNLEKLIVDEILNSHKQLTTAKERINFIYDGVHSLLRPHLIQLASMVLPPDQVGIFLDEIVEGRHNQPFDFFSNPIISAPPTQCFPILPQQADQLELQSSTPQEEAP